MDDTWMDDPPYLAWLDGDDAPFFFLHSAGLGIKDEELPELRPVGSVEQVAGTGSTIYSGADELTAGTYKVTVALFRPGITRSEQSLLLREVQRAAVRTRGVLKDGRVLPITRFTSVKASRRAAVGLGAEVEATFQPAVPYWLSDPERVGITPGTPQSVSVGGDAPVPLTVRITAGAQPVTNPEVQTDAGLTRWLGTVPAGQTLALDARPGVWAVTLGGQDVRLRLTGPQPLLRPGDRALLVTAPGATVDIEYREGWLL